MAQIVDHKICGAVSYCAFEEEITAEPNQYQLDCSGLFIRKGEFVDNRRTLSYFLGSRKNYSKGFQGIMSSFAVRNVRHLIKKGIGQLHRLLRVMKNMYRVVCGIIRTRSRHFLFGSSAMH